MASCLLCTLKLNCCELLNYVTRAILIYYNYNTLVKQLNWRFVRSTQLKWSNSLLYLTFYSILGSTN